MESIKYIAGMGKTLTKRKMGRPPVEDPRDGHLVIRVNRAESLAIREAAKKAGKRLGEYVRHKLLGE